MGKLVLLLLDTFKLIKLDKYTEDNEEYLECNNLTLINFVLKVFGPLHEKSLTIVILLFQVMCSCLAFVIRYPLAKLFYGEVIA